MQRRKIRFPGAIALVATAALVLTACGGGQEKGTGQGPTKVAKIGVIVPLSGDLTAFGVGIRNSVDLAIRQANEKGTVTGWKLELAAEDDTAKPDVGAQAASKLASDSSVVAVIGTLNSSVAQQVQPVLDRAGIAQISPANTNDTLTRGENFRTAPARPHANYFRVSTLDSLQGPFAADYAYNDLRARNVVIIHDKKTYGQGLAEFFQARFEKDGGKVLAVETVNPGDKDFSGVLSKIKPLNPDLIYYGGEYPEASLISSQAKQAGIRAPLIGGDGLVDKTYIDVAGAAAEGDLATNVGPDASTLPSARSFIEAYNAAGFKDPPSAYGALAYDAANAVIAALAKVLPGKPAIDAAVRQEVIRAIQQTNLEGVTGKVAFDQYGDAVTKLLTVYKVTGGEFKPEKSGEFAG